MNDKPSHYFFTIISPLATYTNHPSPPQSQHIQTFPADKLMRPEPIFIIDLALGI
jgi:hypothetical protein